ncbi:MAG: YifB family Mg chelatase-like AAA ATPase [Corynebacterium sp.]|nr:YifB family Mg chelatase-like AAA ATPase [Corynebacterium sp.]
MALAKTLSMTLQGVTAHIVEVEANIGAGLPGTYIVGLASAAVTQARDRIKTAAQNSHLAWPKTKIMVSLLPSDVPKSGSHFDAAIAVAILAATHPNPRVRDSLANTMILGEIGLDGQLRAVPGVLPAILAASAAGIETVIIPEGNTTEALLNPGIDVLSAHSIAHIMEWIHGQAELHRLTHNPEPPKTAHPLDMNQVAGQDEAKFAAEVAAAGGHNLLLIGPRGSGKSMIAERIPTLLPPLTPTEQVESTVVHSVTNSTTDGIVTTAPFIAPHHSITPAALFGGGAGNPRPGAVSLAHNGVLFLDEVSEIPARILDTLRIPMESGRVQLQRAHRTVTFPARFQLIMAANPCHCAAELPENCTCPAVVRARYLSNLSGPLRDRIDIFSRTYNKGPLTTGQRCESSRSIAERVAQARARARWRWDKAGFGPITTAALDPCVLRNQFPADEAGMAMLSSYLAMGEITQRGVDRVLKLAWTLADLNEQPTPTLEHVAQALDLRGENLS